ncbi:hypothetical protein, partial [Pontibacter qinzhouensis]|uniref:hypothetical protein n=1 Tax=Pontibacter qinzhouensis TaxID=2603253 RepID=UPI001C9D603E
MSLTNANFSIWENLESLAFTFKTETTKSGTLYHIEITFEIPVLRTYAGSLVDRLSNTKTTAIIEDENGRFWLLGFKQGLTS